jgi:predicted acetyltransferase
VTRALDARTYDAQGRLVLDITDPLGYAQGRLALEAERDGNGSVTPVSEPADPAMDVSALGTLYLGDQTV